MRECERAGKKRKERSIMREGKRKKGGERGKGISGRTGGRKGKRSVSGGKEEGRNK